MHTAKPGIFSIVILGWTSSVMARSLNDTDYVAVRILEPPPVYPGEDCELYSAFVTPCAPGPGFAGGLDNQGNVIGPLETSFPHEVSAQDLGVWLRETGYTGEIRDKFKMLPGQVYRGREQPYAGPDGDQRAFGFILVRKVTSDGIMYGIANIGNGSLSRYDIKTDEWRSMGFGMGGGGNNLGITVAGARRPGAAYGQYDGKVLDTNLVKPNGPFDIEEAGVIQTFSPPFFVNAISAMDINDDNIIVGSFDDAIDGFPSEDGVPVKLLMDGPNHWSEEYVALEEIYEPGIARADQISNSDPAFAIGWYRDATQQFHGAVWNVNTTKFMVDFGSDRCAHSQCGVHDISPDGTMVVGARLNFSVFPPSREHFIAWTTDGWETHQEVNANDILEKAAGGEHIAEITKLTGINDNGQVTAQALIHGEFGEYVTPGVSNWDPAVATDPNCPKSDPGVWKTGNGCGIPILLDTMALMQVLKGDVNNDGSVDNLDITPFIAALAAADEAAFLTQFPEGNYTSADIDTSGSPDNLDITPFIGLLTATGATAVPEPGSFCLLALALASSMARPRKSLVA